MIGAVFPNGNINILLLPNEIDEQLPEEINGTLFHKTHVGELKFSVEDITEKVEVEIEDIEDKDPHEKDNIITSLHLKLKRSEFERLKERRSIGDHQGFRQIDISEKDYESIKETFDLQHDSDSMLYQYLIGKS